MPNKYRDALVQIHRDLYPERYIPADELDNGDYNFNGDCVEWDAGTIEWVAQAIENALEGSRADVRLDPQHRPLTKAQLAKLELTLMAIGARSTFGTLTCQRKADNAWHFRDGDDSWDENLDGAVSLVLEIKENEDV